MTARCRILCAMLTLIMLWGCAHDDSPSTPLKSASLTMMTFNLRYGLADDGLNSWEYRQNRVMSVIGNTAPHIIGVQEALEFQLDSIRVHFPEYVMVELGRDANGAGESTAIFYLENAFDLLDESTFWLSDTPETPSQSWGNRFNRICTWADFKRKDGGQQFSVLNTHLDHESQVAREKSVKLIKQRLERYPDAHPLVLMGDFNAGEDNPAIAILQEKKGEWRDTYRVIAPEAEEVGTFNGWLGETAGPKIDYIFVNEPWQVEHASIIRDHAGGRYPSDHFPVSAQIRLP